MEVEDFRKRKLEDPGDHPLEVALGLWLPCSLDSVLNSDRVESTRTYGSDAAQISQKCVNLASHTCVTF